MASGVKFRTYPTRQQQILLNRWISAQAEVYSAKVAEAEQLGLGRLKKDSSEAEITASSSQFDHLQLGGDCLGVPAEILKAGASRWRRSFWRYLRGMGGKPVPKKRKYGKQTVALWPGTFQLYSLIETRQVVLDVGGGVGPLRYKAHREYKIPRSLTITREAGRWYVSFAYGSWSCPDIEPEVSPFDFQEEFLSRAMRKTAAELENCSLAVAGCLPAVDSDGVVYDLEAGARRSLEVKDRRRNRYLRRLKRMRPDSNRRRKLQEKIDRLNQHRTNTLRDYAEKVSRKLADHPAEVIMFESVKSPGLNWQQMPGHTRTRMRITSRTIVKCGSRKLIAVLPQKQGTFGVPTVPTSDPVALRERGLSNIRYGMLQLWQRRSYKKDVKSVSKPTVHSVRVGHAEIKCGDNREATLLGLYAVLHADVTKFGKDSSTEQDVISLLTSERIISDEIAQFVCSEIKRESILNLHKADMFLKRVGMLRDEQSLQVLQKYGLLP